MVEVPKFLITDDYGVSLLAEGGEEPPACDCDGNCTGKCQSCTGECQTCSGACSTNCQYACEYNQKASKLFGRFSWSSTVAEDAPFKISARDWAKLIAYIDNVAGTWGDSFSATEPDPGDEVYAEYFNEVAAGVHEYGSFPANTKVKGSLIQAQDFIDLATAANNMIIPDYEEEHPKYDKTAP